MPSARPLPRLRRRPSSFCCRSLASSRRRGRRPARCFSSARRPPGRSRRARGSSSRRRSGVRRERLRRAAAGVLHRGLGSRGVGAADASRVAELAGRSRRRGGVRDFDEDAAAHRGRAAPCCARCSEEEEKKKISWKARGQRGSGALWAKGDGGRRRGASGGPFGGAASFAPPWPLLFSFSAVLLLWFLFEVIRFGKPGGGYTGETFSYPFFTGLLRLTVFPNKGLFWYAPFVLLAPLGFLVLVRRDARLALALYASSLSLLFAASAWWAWDGQAGWGPRLLLPGLPPFVFLAGLACASSGRPARVGRCAGSAVRLRRQPARRAGAVSRRLCALGCRSPAADPGGAGGRHGVRDRARVGRRSPRDGSPSPLPDTLLVADPRSRPAPRGEAEGGRGGEPRDGGAPPARPALQARVAEGSRARDAPRAGGRFASGGEESISWRRKKGFRIPGTTRRGIRRCARSTRSEFARARALGEETARMTLAWPRWSPSRFGSAAARRAQTPDSRASAALSYLSRKSALPLLPLPATPGSSSSARWRRRRATSRAFPKTSARASREASTSPAARAGRSPPGRGRCGRGSPSAGGCVRAGRRGPRGPSSRGRVG